MEETDTSLVSHNVLLSPCCGKGYFHRLCIQQQAYAAGYHHLRCSLCNNSDKFVKEMLRHGINVPNQDAIWEIEGLFDDLYERYARCDVENCCCVMGRNHQESQGPWRIIRCNVCGQAGRHFYCLEDKSNHQQWECEVCSGMKSTETDVATSRLEWRSSESNQSDPLIDKLLPNLGQTSIIDLSSPEPDRGKPLSGTMEIYNEDNKNQSRVPSLESCKTGYSSPGDQTSFKDSGDQTRQRSFWLSFSVVERQQEYLLSPYENKDETTTLTDLGLDDSVSFVRAISATPTANPRKSKPCQRLDVHDVDSELSDTDLEPPVYRFTFEQ
ncbi:G2/M phase-specific E3 ubiquitin-protein ligase-like isoform X2 [Corticium candelabrum]|nr:G2/M phase-specific E3 ubiquitin-protein ligase-like isoform X2 [Corticium candelabrum]XP_062513840.1 G2/M phase-specific E3 ubiquitin-protein ligase-like isoform X2 [Corticium candelabrum]